jgi:hypothetical protein
MSVRIDIVPSWHRLAGPMPSIYFAPTVTRPLLPQAVVLHHLRCQIELLLYILSLFYHTVLKSV